MIKKLKVLTVAVICLVCTACGKNAADNASVTDAPDACRQVIVLDAGHGKSSLEMSAEEKKAEGYEYNEAHNGWGEWRHYKNGTFGEDCGGEGCTSLAPEGGGCWYGMGYGDRNIEPDINLQNALSAKRYLEQMGYEVRMTRSTNEGNPSMNKRVSYCFRNNDISETPDAAAYICIHSNADGGSGTSYIRLSGEYCQGKAVEGYEEKSNAMAEIINSRIAEATGLRNNPPIDLPYLILFNKCPVPIAYLEIGFYDNDEDREIIKNSYDKIGQAIAEGVDEYLKK